MGVLAKRASESFGSRKFGAQASVRALRTSHDDDFQIWVDFLLQHAFDGHQSPGQ